MWYYMLSINLLFKESLLNTVIVFLLASFNKFIVISRDSTDTNFYSHLGLPIYRLKHYNLIMAW